MAFAPLENVPLAPYTTLGVGGPARFFAEARDEGAAREALRWARARGVPMLVLGGGSNLVVADSGVDSLVLRMGLLGVRSREAGGEVELTAAAGEPWDGLVALAVGRGWAGIECLSGIPGSAGATPIQNVGAYGVEASGAIASVRVLDTHDGRVRVLRGRECGFAYRDSRFKSREPGRHVVLSVTYRLRPGGRPAVAYAELAGRLEAAGKRAPALSDVRACVLDIRRSKSMVLDDPSDPNRRSCGSFFTNPVVSRPALARVERRVRDTAMPRWPQPGGRVKLSAAWLIERAGFRRGFRDGRAGLSTRHALAVVARAGASAADVLAFAGRLRAAVRARFGVRLELEPVVWGQANCKGR